jgi:glycosyltransferase involved in cell wall biosynthesis
MSLKNFLLINRPVTWQQRDLLKDLAGQGCRFTGLERGGPRVFQDYPVDDEIFFKMAERSIKRILESVKLFKDSGFEESVIFLDNEEYTSRPKIKIMLYLAGIGAMMVSPSGKYVRRNGWQLLSDVFIMSWLSRMKWLLLETYSMLWLCGQLVTVPFTARRKRSRKDAGRSGHNILLMTYCFLLGGVETVVIDLIEGIKGGEYRPHVLVMKGSTGDGSIRWMNETNIGVTFAETSNRPFTLILTLYKYMRNNNIDILHYHGANVESIPARLAAYFAGVPAIILHIHGLPDVKFVPWKDSSFFKLLAKCTSRFIVVSEFIKYEAIRKFGYPEGKVKVIYNGVGGKYFKTGMPKDEARKILGLPSGVKIICIAGRFSPEKGHLVLVEALHEIKDSCNFLCIICGTGLLEDEIKERAKVLGLEDRVVFLGQRDDMETVYDAVDLVVQSSTAESFGLVVVEAMAKGLPVIASAVGGIPEIIRHGVTGFLVPPDDHNALAAAITAVLYDDGLMKRVGEAARSDVRERFGVKVFVKNIKAVYDSCLEDNVSL